MSDENRIRLIATQPIRGRIIDRNGFVLADSKLKYSLIVKPQYVKESDWQKYKETLSDLLDLDIKTTFSSDGAIAITDLPVEGVKTLEGLEIFSNVNAFPDGDK